MRSTIIFLFFCALWSFSYATTFQATLTTHPYNIGANEITSGFTDGTYGYLGCEDAIVKVNLNTQEVVGIIYLTGVESQIISSVQDNDIGYFGTETDPGIVIKVNLTTFTRLDSLTLDSGEAYLRSGFRVGNYAYFGTSNGANFNRLVKIDLTTFTKSASLNYDYATWNLMYDCTNDATYAYCSFASSVVRINLASLTHVDSITLSSNENNPDGAIIVGNYLYFTVYDTSSFSTARLLKIQVNTFSRVDSISIDATKLPRSIVTDGTYLYATTGSASKDDFENVVRIKISDSSVSILSLPVGYYNIYSSFVNNGKAYLLGGTRPASVVVVDLGTFTFDSVFIVKTVTNMVSSTWDDDYFYFGNNNIANTYGSIYKIDRHTFEYIDAITTNAGEAQVRPAFRVGNYAYFGIKTIDVTSSSKLTRINLSNFTRDSTITLSCSGVHSVVTVGDYAYLGCSSNPGGIVKVQLSTFQQVGSVTTSVAGVGELVKGLEVATTDGTYGYFGSIDSPGKIVKFALSDLSVSSIITVTGVTQTRSGAVFDGYGYFGFQGGQIVKIKLSDMSIDGTTPTSLVNLNQANVFDPYIYFTNLGATTLNSTLVRYTMATRASTTYKLSTYAFATSVSDGIGNIYYASNTYPGSVYQVTVEPNCANAVGGVLLNGESRTVYAANTSCDTSCSAVQGSVTCTLGVVFGNSTLGYTTCTPSGVNTCGQQRIFLTANQVVPTGTMMGELGIKVFSHRFQISANETVAILGNKYVDMTMDWVEKLGEGTYLENRVQKKFYKLSLTTEDLKITFLRKVYHVAGLEDQYHFDYSAKLTSTSSQFHGLLGQTWEDKYFAEKAGTSFQYLDGEEEDYRIQSNNIFGDDFTFNKFSNM